MWCSLSSGNPALATHSTHSLTAPCTGHATGPLPYLCLQVGRYGPTTFDFSAERVVASVRESLARLQTPYIDIIQCHDIEFGSLDQVGG